MSGGRGVDHHDGDRGSEAARRQAGPRRLRGFPVTVLCESAGCDVGALIQAAYLPWRGTDIIHFLFATPMREPKVFFPRQHPSVRKLQNGDVISCEITASFWEHWGQTLRTMTLREPPTPLYRRLHAVAKDAFEAIFHAARPGARSTDRCAHDREGRFQFLRRPRSRIRRRLSPADHRITAAGERSFSGFRTAAENDAGDPAERDRPAAGRGVQMGELIVVTETGAETLHTIPRTLTEIVV